MSLCRWCGQVTAAVIGCPWSPDLRHERVMDAGRWRAAVSAAKGLPQRVLAVVDTVAVVKPSAPIRRAVKRIVVAPEHRPTPVVAVLEPKPVASGMAFVRAPVDHERIRLRAGEGII